MRQRDVVYPVRAGRSNLSIGLSLTFIIFVSVCIMCCSGPQVQKGQEKGVYHIVKKGETAYSIARAYALRVQDLAEINNISDVSTLKEGMVIFIPDANQVIDDISAQEKKSGTDSRRNGASDTGKISSDRTKRNDTMEKVPGSRPPSSLEPGVAAPAPGPKTFEKPPAAEKQDDLKIEKGRFAWPVKGVVKTRFGIQPNKAYHNNSWIKIACPAGARVKAAASGTVIFSARLKDFGETVIMSHVNNFATVYTHLKTRQVKADQSVNKGEIIALAGEKDESGDTYVNFEIRFKGKARNPLLYLP